MESLRDRFRGALVGVGVGDAAGAPFEGRPVVDEPAVGAWLDGDEPLRWTDDTAMTVGLAESLLAAGGFDGEDLARRFVAHHAAEPWRGYGAGPPVVFRAIAEGARWDEPARALFGGQGSFGNGGAMRAVPAGLFACGDPDAAARLGAAQATVTHAHPLGREAAGLLAAAVAVVVTGAVSGRRALTAALTRHAPSRELATRLHHISRLGGTAPPAAAAVLGNGIAAVESVPAALQAFCSHPDSFRSVVGYAVRLGGDTDTIAAMAGGLAGAHVGLAGIPAQLRDRLEQADRLVELGDALAEAVATPST